MICICYTQLYVLQYICDILCAFDHFFGRLHIMLFIVSIICLFKLHPFLFSLQYCINNFIMNKYLLIKFPFRAFFHLIFVIATNLFALWLSIKTDNVHALIKHRYINIWMLNDFKRP